MIENLEAVLNYHQATKHEFQRYARGPGYMDWATQPDPFRRYPGAALIRLERNTSELPEVLYDEASARGRIPPAPVNARTISQLFLNSLALSAWKSAGGTSWALRVNPSSGNLHPTEGYLVSGPVQGLSDDGFVCHYAPKEHALERRAVIPSVVWQNLADGLPPGSFLMGLSSIHWRESWKYGERAYRYCQLDLGHAIAAISLAASGLGWRALLMDSPSTDRISDLLGVSGMTGPEREHADGLVLVLTRPVEETGDIRFQLPDPSELKKLDWEGRPNQLSRGHMQWDIIDTVARACRKPSAGAEVREDMPSDETRPESVRPNLLLSRIVQQRRSAVSMDGVTRMSAESFFRILVQTMPGGHRFPHATLPWSPKVHLALFVHRVDGLPTGLYMLVRRADALSPLQEAMLPGFLWKRPHSCPDGLPLFLLKEGDFRQAAQQIACLQEIAGDGCFSTAMIAEFDGPLNAHGPWFYPRLFWECGLIGQVLYLEAEAAGLRATGIGCYFDDPMHHLLGLKSTQYQDLYHLTAGGPIEDGRLTTLPPYRD
jgi:SagB-type dehydrogenase family enzyme